MGAEFLYALIPVCELTAERLAEAKRQMRANVAALDADDRDAFEFEITAENLVVRLDALLDGYNEIGAYRDVAALKVGEEPATYWISGGMSWGDPPTERYQVLNDLELAGLFDLLETWSRADAAARANGNLRMA